MADDDGGDGDLGSYRRGVEFETGEASVRWSTAVGPASLAVLPVPASGAFLVELSSAGPVEGVLTLGLNRETALGAPGSRGAVNASRARAQASAYAGVLRLLVSPQGDFTDTVAQTVLVAGTGVDVAVEHDDAQGVRVRVSATAGIAALAVAIDVRGPGFHTDAPGGERRCRSVFDDVAAAVV
ncbi:hypothetical protein H1V43_36705 [Streptomyces sp. PSKA54]|uniref:Uncharacterized protein n=1 Tax=Streptomyces himalayensis subsp. aureolus TaxID=2758039 RepID=A0A7W2D8H5_9ACTN|nr:hypothetical protein [Streptomyces himalayensis]MBA4866742.1 hypothetical protein [Streptomyces himalayensis subsp. aureolus]